MNFDDYNLITENDTVIIVTIQQKLNLILGSFNKSRKIFDVYTNSTK